MAEAAARACAVLDGEAAARLEAWDDVVDDLHTALLRELFGLREAPAEALVELGLVARFYERIADHALVIGERVRFVASGEMVPGDRDERPS